jgi:hypothetical protein
MANMTHHLASQQNGVITGLRINCETPGEETYNLSVPGSLSNYQMEMERYLMECIKHHQKLIECVKCRISWKNPRWLLESKFISLYVSLQVFREVKFTMEKSFLCTILDSFPPDLFHWTSSNIRK